MSRNKHVIATEIVKALVELGIKAEDDGSGARQFVVKLSPTYYSASDFTLCCNVVVNDVEVGRSKIAQFGTD